MMRGTAALVKLRRGSGGGRRWRLSRIDPDDGGLRDNDVHAIRRRRKDPFYSRLHRRRRGRLFRLFVVLVVLSLSGRGQGRS